MSSRKMMVVRSATLAKYLCNHGLVIRDIKPHREIQNASCFIFEYEEKLFELLTMYKAEKEQMQTDLKGDIEGYENY